jgi:hypothetical protein
LTTLFIPDIKKTGEGSFEDPLIVENNFHLSPASSLASAAFP